MHEIDTIIATCRELIDARRRSVIITVVRTEGSTYRRAGARAVIEAHRDVMRVVPFEDAAVDIDSEDDLRKFRTG